VWLRQQRCGLAYPTVKPVQMVSDAILDASARGDIVLDTFLGSGSSHPAMLIRVQQEGTLAASQIGVW